MELVITCCSAFLEDFVFGALYNAFNCTWTGSCASDPGYDPEDKRKAVLHAYASSTDKTTPFLAILVLPI